MLCEEPWTGGLRQALGWLQGLLGMGMELISLYSFSFWSVLVQEGANPGRGFCLCLSGSGRAGLRDLVF